MLLLLRRILSSLGSVFFVFKNNQPIGDWDVSNVTSTTEMLKATAAFNQPIGGWDVGNVTSMNDMFQEATSFNQPLDNWNVSSVRVLNDMFNGATSFNHTLNSWDVSSVTNAQRVFAEATAFNQPVNNWNVSNMIRIQGMFNNATAFNQSLGNWTLRSNAMMSDMLGSSGIDYGNYNNDLIGWASSPATPDGRTISIGGLIYGPPAVEARNNLINKGWQFSDDSFDASCTSLPVKLVSLEAKKQEFSSLLTWSTTEEINSNRFEVNRSTDAKNWKVIK